MLDFIAIVLLFGSFGLAMAYVRGCDRLKGTPS
jgi:hypothetical protein